MKVVVAPDSSKGTHEGPRDPVAADTYGVGMLMAEPHPPRWGQAGYRPLMVRPDTVRRARG